MMKKILLFLLLAVFTLGISAQGPSKKCPVCGLSIPKCQYKGKHPKKKPTTPAKQQPSKPAKPVSQPTKPVSQPAKPVSQPAKPVSQPTKPVSQPTKPVSQPAKPTPVPTPTRPTTGTLNGYDWVDLGLSVKWATCNIGADSPEDYGDYFAWGETETKSSYDWSNCFDCRDRKGKRWGTYKIGGQTRIAPSSGHDTAREKWGGTWRMPTDAEFEELNIKCDWTWTSQGGHKGYKVTGPNGNSIFLPAAGWRYDTYTIDGGEYGNYWSSTLSSSGSDYASDLYFNSSSHYTGAGDRRNGQGVRPVTD